MWACRRACQTLNRTAVMHPRSQTPSTARPWQQALLPTCGRVAKHLKGAAALVKRSLTEVPALQTCCFCPRPKVLLCSGGGLCLPCDDCVLDAGSFALVLCQSTTKPSITTADGTRMISSQPACGVPELPKAAAASCCRQLPIKVKLGSPQYETCFRWWI
jgi:hypothetical protein